MKFVIIAVNEKIAEYEDETQKMLSKELQLQKILERDMESTAKAWNINPKNAQSF